MSDDYQHLANHPDDQVNTIEVSRREGDWIADFRPHTYGGHFLHSGTVLPLHAAGSTSDEVLQAVRRLYPGACVLLAECEDGRA